MPSHAKDVVLQGFDKSMISKTLVFEIRKCQNENLRDDQPRCHPNQTELDDFIKDIQVESWVNYDSVNLREHKKDPYFTTEIWMNTFILDPALNKRNNIMVRKN